MRCTDKTVRSCCCTRTASAAACGCARTGDLSCARSGSRCLCQKGSGARRSATRRSLQAVVTADAGGDCDCRWSCPRRDGQRAAAVRSRYAPDLRRQGCSVSTANDAVSLPLPTPRLVVSRVMLLVSTESFSVRRVVRQDRLRAPAWTPFPPDAWEAPDELLLRCVDRRNCPRPAPKSLYLLPTDSNCAARAGFCRPYQMSRDEPGSCSRRDRLSGTWMQDR